MPELAPVTIATCMMCLSADGASAFRGISGVRSPRRLLRQREARGAGTSVARSSRALARSCFCRQKQAACIGSCDDISGRASARSSPATRAPDGPRPSTVCSSRWSRSRPHRPSMSGTVLALIAQGAKRLALGDGCTSTAPGSTWSPRSTCRSPASSPRPAPMQPALGFGLTLRPVRRRRAAAGPGRGVRAAPRGAPRRGSRSATRPRELLDAVVRLLRLLDDPATAPCSRR